MQLSTYLPSYSEFLSRAGSAGATADESLVIGEQFVPVESLVEFLARARRALRSTGVQDIYGTIRSIRADDRTFLRWAKRDYVCVIFNLRTAHTHAGVQRTMQTFRALNDAALAMAGSFYLTYQRAATRGQIERAYPEFERFLELKQQFDPECRFTSDWYTHHAAMFGQLEHVAEAVRH